MAIPEREGQRRQYVPYHTHACFDNTKEPRKAKAGSGCGWLTRALFALYTTHTHYQLPVLILTVRPTLSLPTASQSLHYLPNQITSPPHPHRCPRAPLPQTPAPRPPGLALGPRAPRSFGWDPATRACRRRPRRAPAPPVCGVYCGGGIVMGLWRCEVVVCGKGGGGGL